MFVYGTLKNGQPNSYILQAAIDKSQAKFLGQATTVDCWPLIVYSSFNVPFLLDCKGTGKASIFSSFNTPSVTCLVWSAALSKLVSVSETRTGPSVSRPDVVEGD